MIAPMTPTAPAAEKTIKLKKIAVAMLLLYTFFLSS